MLPAKSSRSPRILLIDDEPQSVALLLAYLRDVDMDILVALDGEDGLRKARLGKPDMILLDVVMPDKDGYEVCRQIKAAPDTAGIPILFLSAGKSLPNKLEAFAAGGVDYIPKPFSAEEVLARIRTHLDIKNHVARLEAMATRSALNAAKNGSPDDALFGRALVQIETTLACPSSIRELARHMKTTERKLAALFRQRIGMTVNEYCCELRLETARRLLAGSGMRIQTIADRVGYRNAGDFTRAFRRRYGMAPRTYRQSHSQEVAAGEMSGQ